VQPLDPELLSLANARADDAVPLRRPDEEKEGMGVFSGALRHRDASEGRTAFSGAGRTLGGSAKTGTSSTEHGDSSHEHERSKADHEMAEDEHEKSNSQHEIDSAEDAVTKVVNVENEMQQEASDEHENEVQQAKQEMPNETQASSLSTTNTAEQT
jgi:predicted RND superfamily exporter protein